MGWYCQLPHLYGFSVQLQPRRDRHDRPPLALLLRTGLLLVSPLTSCLGRPFVGLIQNPAWTELTQLRIVAAAVMKLKNARLTCSNRQASSASGSDSWRSPALAPLVIWAVAALRILTLSLASSRQAE